MGPRFTVIAILTVIVLIAYDKYYPFNESSNNSSNTGQAGVTIKDSKSEGKALIGGDFVLVDQNGKEFSSDKLNGKTSLIYFGFTNCPMICPTALNNMSLVMNELGEDSVNYTPVFITTDPERDTAESLKSYMSSFHLSFVGLTGSEEQLKVAYDDYKVYAKKVELDGEDGYDMNHSSIIYVMNENGEYVSHFNHETAPEKILAKLRSLK